jgi:hypothetical protein
MRAVAMTFPRRGTRRFTVDGQYFNWHVSPKWVDAGGSICTVQARAGKGQILHFWPNDGFPSPREVREVILFALEHGWTPNGEGAPLWVDRGELGLHVAKEPLARRKSSRARKKRSTG